MAGVMVQVTAVLAAPETVGVNCWDWPAVRVTSAGLRTTLTRLTRVTEAPPILLPSATEMALTVIEGEPTKLAGAV